MKKILSMVFVLALCVSVLTACGKPSDTSSAPMVGGVLFLEGTISDATDKSFTLTMDNGGSVKVAVGVDTEIVATDGIKDGNSVAVGCLRVDDKNVNATYIRDRSADSKVDGAVLYIRGTVSEVKSDGFTLTMEEGTKIKVNTGADVVVKGGEVVDGAKVAVGCKRIDEKTVEGISIEIK